MGLYTCHEAVVVYLPADFVNSFCFVVVERGSGCWGVVRVGMKGGRLYGWWRFLVRKADMIPMMHALGIVCRVV